MTKKLVYGWHSKGKIKNRVCLPTAPDESIDVLEIEKRCPGLLHQLQLAGLKQVGPGQRLSFKIKNGV
jgi:hypothetical protein